MTKKRWLVQMDDDRLYFCIRHVSGRINTIGRFTGCEENAIYMVELMNEAHDARELVKAREEARAVEGEVVEVWHLPTGDCPVRVERREAIGNRKDIEESFDEIYGENIRMFGCQYEIRSKA